MLLADTLFVPPVQINKPTYIWHVSTITVLELPPRHTCSNCTRVTPNNMWEWRPRRSNKTRTSTTGRNDGSTSHFLYQQHLKSKTIRSGLSKAKNIWHSHDDRFDLFTKQHRQRFLVLEVTMHFNATVYIRKLRHIRSGSNCSFIHSSLTDVIKY